MQTQITVDELLRDTEERARRAERLARTKARQALRESTLWREHDRALQGALRVVGEATWGEDSYTVIPPVDGDQPVWYLLRQEGDISGFTVALEVVCADLDTVDESTPDGDLARVRAFILQGDGPSLSVDSTEFANGFREMFRQGPNQVTLPPATARAFGKAAYRTGEYDTKISYWWTVPLLLALVLSALLLAYVGEIENKSILLAAMLFACAGFGIAAATTGFGSRFRRLSSEHKAAAVLAALPGAATIAAAVLVVAFFAAIFFLAIFILAAVLAAIGGGD
jgi:hypothetical protein